MEEMRIRMPRWRLSRDRNEWTKKKIRKVVATHS
jgi:hypothetical protein